MKAHEIRERTLGDIESDIKTARENLQNLQFRLVTSQLDNTSTIKKAKKELARLKTVYREKELGMQANQEAVKPAGGEKT
jgi:large subunit ribosomal protein L29